MVEHSKINEAGLRKLMLDTSKLAKDVGTILDGDEAVAYGLIDEVGGIEIAFNQLNKMIDERETVFDKGDKMV